MRVKGSVPLGNDQAAVTISGGPVMPRGCGSQRTGERGIPDPAYGGSRLSQNDAVSTGSLIRLYRPGPRWVYFPFEGEFVYVVIDGREVGEIWPEQVRAFTLAPGKHEVKLQRRLMFAWGGSISVDLARDEVLDLACTSEWGFWMARYIGLHAATDTEKARMLALTKPHSPPRDLGAAGPA